MTPGWLADHLVHYMRGSHAEAAPDSNMLLLLLLVPVWLVLLLLLLHPAVGSFSCPATFRQDKTKGASQVQMHHPPTGCQNIS
jgi:hypothetical protein